MRLHILKVIKTRAWDWKILLGFFKLIVLRIASWKGLITRIFSLLQVQVEMSKVSIKFLVILYHSYCYSFCCLFRFYDTTHRGLKIMLMLILFPGNAFQRHLTSCWRLLEACVGWRWSLGWRRLGWSLLWR